jgi:hypothetical protein
MDTQRVNENPVNGDYWQVNGDFEGVNDGSFVARASRPCLTTLPGKHERPAYASTVKMIVLPPLSSKKRDISNELRKGTFLKSFDKFQRAP